jgi:hypothetical protein
MLVVALVVAFVMPCASAQEARLLFLSKSEGFEHGPVAVKDGKPCLAETVLTKLAQENGATIKSTKDANAITAENLKNYDIVVFYTQGDLLKPSKDGGAPMGPNGVSDLLDWIKKGGRYMGFHSASDTFHTPEGAEVTPYLKMVGAEFIGHGPQFFGTVKVVDSMHSAMAAFPKEWKIKEEWYAFKNFNAKDMHVMALMDPGDDAARKLDLYKNGAYPIIWCSAYGEGKVYFNGMGHREELWEDPIFTQSIVDAATWLMEPSSAASDTKPNYDEVMATVKKVEPKK